MTRICNVSLFRDVATSYMSVPLPRVHHKLHLAFAVPNQSGGPLKIWRPQRPVNIIALGWRSVQIVRSPPYIVLGWRSVQRVRSSPSLRPQSKNTYCTCLVQCPLPSFEAPVLETPSFMKPPSLERLDSTCWRTTDFISKANRSFAVTLKLG